MSNNRIIKKQMQRNYRNQYIEMNRCMARQEEMLTDITKKLAQQQEILGLFYEEYQELKKRSEKQYLMSYIRMRESMLKDMSYYVQRNQTNTQGYKLLSMYVNEYTELLEDHGVEILDCKPHEYFNPETQKPIERVGVVREEYQDLICRVYGSGYRWNGIMLKKIDVAVGVYK